MQELEKILKEIDEIKFGFDTECRSECDLYDWSCGACVGECGEYIKERAKDIIRKHMNDGWIPVDERLPMRTFDEKINESYQKYLVFIDGVDGWDIDIAVYDFWNDKKWREAHDGYGEIENVIAWCPLPEPYRPERSDNHDGE